MESILFSQKDLHNYSKEYFDNARSTLLKQWDESRGVLDEETLESISELIEINKLGFLTENSQ